MEDITGMFYETEPPLNEVISHFYHLHHPIDSLPVVQHLSPNFEMMLVFNYGPPIRFSFNDDPLQDKAIHQTAVIGPLRRMLNYELVSGADAIVANFTLNGFYRLFKVPVHELAGGDFFDPDILIDKTCFSDLWARVSELDSMENKIRLLCEYSMSFIKENEAGSGPLLDSIPYFKNPSIQPVKAIASDTSLTVRTIQSRFQKYLGYSPKELLRFLRFKEVVQQILNQKEKQVEIFDLINTYGYHDQSHLTKDFNHFMGTTPKKFINEIAAKEFCISKTGKYYG